MGAGRFAWSRGRCLARAMADPDVRTDVDLRDNAAARQYEAWSDGVLAGRAEYRLSDGVITFIHTVVNEQFRGRGIASALIEYALDDVRARGERSVVARCVMVRGWIERHEDYQDLLRTSRSRTGQGSADG
jgi:predicted GNAT family acetyltransferase